MDGLQSRTISSGSEQLLQLFNSDQSAGAFFALQISEA